MASSSNAPTTPVKGPTSPAKFVKPADLFKMRRRSSVANSNSIPSVFLATPNSRDSCTGPISESTRSSPYKPHTPKKTSQQHQNQANSGTKIHNMFRMSNSNFGNIEPQSPLKCLNNLADPSPTKNLPKLLKNPFSQPVKRRLNLGFSPTKQGGSPYPNSNKNSCKKSRMIDIDEDANMEAPKMKLFVSPTKARKQAHEQCSPMDWTLKTRLRIQFDKQCKNWNVVSNTIHKRLLNTPVEESPSRANDRTISIEAIKNVTTIYQHPYMAWLPLYPRVSSEFDNKHDNLFRLTKHTQATQMMHDHWVDSLEDLSNLLIDGRCAYFYLCSDNYNILFKSSPSSHPRRPHVQAYISPFSCGMGTELNKSDIGFRCPELKQSNSSSNLCASGPSMSTSGPKENSQTSSSMSQRSTTFLIEDDLTQDSRETRSAKVTTSIDSGNVSDCDDDCDNYGEDENGDASQFLESIGLSQQDFPTLQCKRKGFVETDSNTQSRTITSNKSLALIEGADNIRKLVKFLQTNRLYTMSTVGKFACIPPTLLAPREFRLSTPLCPEVKLSKNMIESSTSAPSQNSANQPKPQPVTVTPKKSNLMNNNVTHTKGPTFVELKGPILPSLYKSLHNLLTFSDNADHTCTSTTLDLSQPYKTIPY